MFCPDFLTSNAVIGALKVCFEEGKSKGQFHGVLGKARIQNIVVKTYG